MGFPSDFEWGRRSFGVGSTLVGLGSRFSGRITRRRVVLRFRGNGRRFGRSGGTFRFRNYGWANWGGFGWSGLNFGFQKFDGNCRMCRGCRFCRGTFRASFASRRGCVRRRTSGGASRTYLWRRLSRPSVSRTGRGGNGITCCYR